MCLVCVCVYVQCHVCGIGVWYCCNVCNVCDGTGVCVCPVYVMCLCVTHVCVCVCDRNNPCKPHVSPNVCM